MSAGAMISPPIGGGLFALGHTVDMSDNLQFLFPFLVVAVLPVVLFVVAIWAIPAERAKDKHNNKSSSNDNTSANANANANANGNRNDSGNGAKQTRSCCKRPMGLRHFVILAGLIYTATVMSMTRPTLEIRLGLLGVRPCCLVLSCFVLVCYLCLVGVVVRV